MVTSTLVMGVKGGSEGTMGMPFDRIRQVAVAMPRCFRKLLFEHMLLLQLLLQDTVAGITVGVILIPQSMAYAILAGLPPIYGMYACTVPLFVYAMLASSTQLQIGTVATTALMLRSTVEGLSPVDEPEFIRLTIAVTFVTGLLQICFGIFKLGFISNLLSAPVMVGYTSASALIIFGSQLKSFFGLHGVGTSSSFFTQIYDVIKFAHTGDWGTTLLSVMALLALKNAKRLGLPKWFPVPLVVMILATLLSYALNFEAGGIATVGTCACSRCHWAAVSNLWPVFRKAPPPCVSEANSATSMQHYFELLQLA
jgi:SulP family sulfate permease